MFGRITGGSISGALTGATCAVVGCRRRSGCTVRHGGVLLKHVLMVLALKDRDENDLITNMFFYDKLAEIPNALESYRCAVAAVAAAVNADASVVVACAAFDVDAAVAYAFAVAGVAYDAAAAVADVAHWDVHDGTVSRTVMHDAMDALPGADADGDDDAVAVVAAVIAAIDADEMAANWLAVNPSAGQRRCVAHS